ncbi:MAG: hypothetical protein ACTSQH_02090 [Candidatus Hodarchaeales archaeon]
MNVDPFSFNTSMVEKEPQVQSHSSCIGFYICSFDISQGLQVLYSYPSKLKANQEEVNTLKTHFIWRFEFIPIRVDLKFSEFIYSGFQLHKSPSQDIVATVEDPLFGVILKLWKDGPFIPKDLLNEFKKDLQEFHWDDINLLFRQQSLSSNPSRRREYKKLLPEIQKVEKSLKTAWKSFQGKISHANVTQESKSGKIDSKAIQPNKRVSPVDLFIRKITMRIVSIKDSDQIFVILFNNGKLLKEVSITVSKRTDFFSEILWQQSVDLWPTKEDLVLEFQRSNVITNYLVKISSKDRTIAMKSLMIDS